MVQLASLWLPIVLSGVAIFFLGFLLHVVMPHHKADYAKLPQEDAVVAGLRERGVRAGQYVFPHCGDHKEMAKPEFQKKFVDGPSGFLFVRVPGPVAMGPFMLRSFLFNVIASVLVAYVATVGLHVGAKGIDVFRCTFVTCWLSNAGALAYNSIWGGHSWSSTVRSMIDAVAYAAASAALFAWLWPTG